MPMNNPEAIKICRMLADGMRLRIPHHGAPAELREGLARFGRNRPPIPVAIEIAEDMAASPLLTKLTRDGTIQRGSGRIGWKEAGFDGDVADWYAFTQ